ncbi:hypothetical protein ACSU6B_28645 [Neobacillus sp. C211]|uniref:hypothetical protein n=1 Tax=unclassified Neobacillus TaxID=2675272 RepID=UPI00397C8D51
MYFKTKIKLDEDAEKVTSPVDMEFSDIILYMINFIASKHIQPLDIIEIDGDVKAKYLKISFSSIGSREEAKNLEISYLGTDSKANRLFLLELQSALSDEDI